MRSLKLVKKHIAKYAPHTAYGYKGGTVLSRRSPSSSGGDAVEESYLFEARNAGTSLDSELLGHLSHVKDIPHEDSNHTQTALDLLEEFHKLRQGQPSKITASLKHDGGASVHIVNNGGRIGVSDKWRIDRGEIAYTPEDVDKYFGHAPEYAASLKHFLKHGDEIVDKGQHFQGDLLFTPHDTHRREMGGTTTYTSNRLTYKGKTKAPIGIALHTQIINGVAQSLEGVNIRKSPNIFVPEYRYKPDPHNYTLEARKAVEYHLRKARELSQDFDSSHMTPEHKVRYATYINSTVRGGTHPTVRGYLKFLQKQADTEVGRLKSDAGRQRKQQYYQGLMDHVNANAEGFHRSMQLRHHLQEATDYALSGLRHPDLKTAIDGTDSEGEGVVLSMKDSEGRSRPVSKLVTKKVQRALLTNQRFSKVGRSHATI